MTVIGLPESGMELALLPPEDIWLNPQDGSPGAGVCIGSTVPEAMATLMEAYVALACKAKR